MNQTGWNPSISQFIHVKIILLKMVPDWNPFFFKSTGFISSTFPIQPDFSQNQPAAITLNTGSPRTLMWREKKKWKWFDCPILEDVKNNGDLVVGNMTVGIRSPISTDIKKESWLRCCHWCELWCCFILELKLNLYVFLQNGQYEN